MVPRHCHGHRQVTNIPSRSPGYPGERSTNSICLQAARSWLTQHFKDPGLPAPRSQCQLAKCAKGTIPSWTHSSRTMASAAVICSAPITFEKTAIAQIIRLAGILAAIIQARQGRFTPFLLNHLPERHLAAARPQMALAGCLHTPGEKLGQRMPGPEEAPAGKPPCALLTDQGFSPGKKLSKSLQARIAAPTDGQHDLSSPAPTSC